MDTAIPPDVLEFCLNCGLRRERIADVATLETFFRDLQVANTRTNLTRILAPDDFWIKHVADSLAAGREIPEIGVAAYRIADVGCGAGFPLVPLAWAHPHLQLTGIESRKRKANFVATEARSLGLDNVSVVPRRACEAARLDGVRGEFDLVFARAVGPADRLICECCGLMASGVGARMLFYKTPAGVEREIAAAQREAHRHGLVVRTGEAFELPRGSGHRQFLLVQRIGAPA